MRFAMFAGALRLSLSLILATMTADRLGRLAEVAQPPKKKA